MLAKKSKQSGKAVWSRSQEANRMMPARVLKISEAAARSTSIPARPEGRCKTLEWPKGLPANSARPQETIAPDQLGLFRGIKYALLFQLGAALIGFGAWLTIHLLHHLH